MRQLQKWPDALAGARGPESCDRQILRSPFPHCELRGCCVVDRLPSGCPFAAANPLAAILALTDRGWGRAFGQAVPDLAGGQLDLAHAAVCESCYSRNRGNPHIVYLHKLAAADTTRVPRRTQVPDVMGGVGPTPVIISARRVGRGRR